MMDNLGLVDVSWRDFSDYDYNPLEKNKVYNFTNSKYEVLSTVDYPKLDLNTLDESDGKYLESLDKNLEEIATPTHLVVKNGKVIATRTGALRLDGLTELFKEVGEL